MVKSDTPDLGLRWSAPLRLHVRVTASPPYPGTGFLTALGRGGDGEGTHPGEAVVWSAGERGIKVAVDVGGTIAMGEAVAEQGPQIVVLTHSDSDHIGGWGTYWKHKQRPPLWELWVPYEWALLASVACDLFVRHGSESIVGGAHDADADVRSGPDVAGRAASEPNSVVPGREELASVEDLIEQLRSESRVVNARRSGFLSEQYVLRRLLEPSWRARDDVEDPRGPDDLGEPVDLKEEIKQAARLIESIKDNERVRERLGQAINEIRKETGRDYDIGTPEAVARQALERVGAVIRVLADVAMTDGDIRLFSTEAADKPGLEYPWQREGYRGLATVPNAREVQLLRTRRLSALRFFAYTYSLTVQNRRALSVLLWTDRWDSGSKAMVWSDTSGEWTRRANTPLPLEHIFVTTAPHHGSDGIDHTEAWTALWRVKRKTVFVCAGGSATQGDRVHGGFLAVPLGQRACTRCRHLKKQPAPTDVLVFVGTSSAKILSVNVCPH